MPFARLKLLLVYSLIASTALFAVGVAIERSRSEGTETPSGEVSHTDEGGEGTTEGSSAEESNAAETATSIEHSDAVFLGVDLESWWLVGVAVAVSLGLALAVWFRPLRPVLALTGVVALVFAAFDLAEVANQVTASEPALVAIAAVVALLHLSSAGLAAAAFRAPEAA